MDSIISFLGGYGHLIFVVAVIISALIVNRFLRFAVHRYIQHSSDEIKVDVTRYTLIKNSMSFIVFATAAGLIIYSIPTLRNLSITLFASAGIFAAVLGLASQQAFSNIISGIFIVIFKPFRVGDIIEVGNAQKGVVEDITLRHVMIRNFENRRIIIPNSIISSETIINSSIKEELTCEFCEFGISYDSDIDKAIDIIRQECENHPNLVDARTEEDKLNNVPRVVVRVIRWDESSVALRAYTWAKDPGSAKALHYDLNYSVKKRFDAEGIEIPYPHRTVVMKQK